MADAETDLLRSSLDLLILKSLSWGAMHGYAISEWIQAATDGLLLLEEGTLYPALHRLERRGWISSEWGVSDTNRRAKFYTLTRAGRTQLAKELAQWERMSNAVGLVIRLAPETSL